MSVTKITALFCVFTFVYTIVNVIYFLIYPINRGAGALCAPTIVQTPIDVSLPRVPTGEHRELSTHYTQPGVCKRAAQANYPEKSRKVPMFRRKLPRNKANNRVAYYLNCQFATCQNIVAYAYLFGNQVLAYSMVYSLVMSA